MLQEVSIECPHCGELFVTTADLSEGSYTTVEDCQVCCRPMEIIIEGTVEEIVRCEVQGL
jgi:transcription elongation factor Elf1